MFEADLFREKSFQLLKVGKCLVIRHDFFFSWSRYGKNTLCMLSRNFCFSFLSKFAKKSLFSSLNLLIHSTKILKDHRYISHRVYALTPQLWHSVFSRCFDKFQQNLQKVLSKFQFTSSSENELCSGPIGIHGIKNENWEILKFIRKSHFSSCLSEIPQNMLSVCQALWQTFAHSIVSRFWEKKSVSRARKKSFWKICIFCEKQRF